MSNSTIKFRLDEKLKAKFLEACQSQNQDASKVLREFTQSCVEEFLGLKNNEIDLIKSTNVMLESNIQELTIGEMYCGPGGIGIGAVLSNSSTPSKFRYKHSFAIDYDSDTCKTYEHNVSKFEDDVQVYQADIREFDLNKLPKVDGFLYGFPCNDFSLVGESKGLDGTYGPLYKYGVEYISKNNPKFILAENVSGISSANSGKAFKQILKELRDAGEYGYELTAHLYKFEQYGIPQARHRFIIIGFRKDLGIKFQVPAPNFETKTAKQALEEPPIDSAKITGHEFTRQSKQVVDRLNHIKPGQNAWTADLPEHLKLNVKGAKMSMIYRRLDPDKPSYTITGSGGGGTHVYHYEEPRALTNRERARLQTFPDWFNFSGSKESVRKQIGMAVPVDGAKLILESVLKCFSGVDYKHVKPSVDVESYLSE